MTDAPPLALTHDALLGGRVSLQQPAQGYRAAIDPVLLAASLPADFAGRVADLGCGAGAAALCLAARLSRVTILGIERDAELAVLARRNAAASGVAARLEVLTADLRQLPPALAEGFDAVIANPPYLEPARANPPADARKTASSIEDLTLAAWIEAALRLAGPKALIAVIHRADRLADLLALLRGRAGAIVVIPLWPKRDAAAKRVIVRARKGLRTPLALAPGLVLHEADGRYTAAAEAVLRDAQALALGAPAA